MPPSPLEALLPQPQHLELTGGQWMAPDALYLAADDDALGPAERQAVEQFCDLWERELGLARPRMRTADAAASAHLILRVASPAERNDFEPAGNLPAACCDSAYRLDVRPDGVQAVGATPLGLFYALQTLGQFVRLAGRAWPGVHIMDHPDYPERGLSYDVSRGRVPTPEMLQALADRLAACKMNHLQLYIEHTFAFEFDPDIGRGSSPLTPDELRDFDQYCRDRHIELTPSLASFGHMGRVLSLPAYRHLAEIEARKDWDDMTWHERMRGLTLDAANPEARALLERMYGELLPLFSSPRVNVTCDETYDLAKGKNQGRDPGELYLEHLCWLCELCEKHGKQPMFWGDMVRKFPRMIDRIPKNAIALHWDYDADADYAATALFRDAGLATWVCPGTSSWNRMLNDYETATLNIQRFVGAANQYGASGVLNTDWGDEGHVNAPATSWHPILLGAALSWNAKAADVATIDRAVARLEFGDATGELVQRLRAIARAYDMRRTWPAFCKPLHETVAREDLSDQALTAWHRASAEAAAAFAAQLEQAPDHRVDLGEIEVACRMNVLLAERFILSRAVGDGGGVNPDLARRLGAFADQCAAVMPDYAAVWRLRHKPHRLEEIEAAVMRVAAEARGLAEKGKG